MFGWLGNGIQIISEIQKWILRSKFCLQFPVFWVQQIKQLHFCKCWLLCRCDMGYHTLWGKTEIIKYLKTKCQGKYLILSGSGCLGDYIRRKLMICRILVSIIQGSKIQEPTVSWVCSMDRMMSREFWWGNALEGGHLKDWKEMGG